MNDKRDDDEPTDDARKPRPVTPELRAQVKNLALEGLGRNAIARELEISAGSVTKIAREAKPPIVFDREQTALAVSARQLDLQDIRTRLARKFLVVADETLDMLEAPVTIGAFGGSNNTWNETLLDAPTFEQRKVLVTTAQTAYRSGVELLQADAAAGSTAAYSMVAGLRDALDAGLKALAETGAEVDPTVTPDQRPSDPQPESETPA